MNVDRKFLVMFNGNVNEKLLKENNAKNITILNNFKDIAVCEMTRLDAETLNLSDEIKYITVDGDDKEEQQEISYALNTLQYGRYHNSGVTGKGVKIAVFDGGCQQHEDLKISGGYNSHDRNSNYMVDTGGHGTRCIGTINMQDNNTGYLGIAPDSEMYVIKTNAMSGGASQRGAQAIGMDWCISNGIDIASISLSSTVDDPIRREVFRRATEEHGIIICVSAGNGMSGVPLHYDNTTVLANYDFTISVGGLLENGSIRPSSNRGKVDLVAPGTSVPTTNIDPNNTVSRQYSSPSGTSYSAPLIAGIFALYKQMFPELSREALISKVKENSISRGDKRTYGYGLPQFPENYKSIEMNQDTLDGWLKLLPVTRASNVLGDSGQTVQQLLNLLDFRFGQNENGYFIRFENGIQICWGDVLVQTPNISAGNIYRSDSEFWTFPVPFTPDTPIVAFASASFTSRWASRVGVTSTGRSLPFRQFSYLSSSSAGITSTFALGTWK